MTYPELLWKHSVNVNDQILKFYVDQIIPDITKTLGEVSHLFWLDADLVDFFLVLTFYLSCHAGGATNERTRMTDTTAPQPFETWKSFQLSVVEFISVSSPSLSVLARSTTHT